MKREETLQGDGQSLRHIREGKRMQHDADSLLNRQNLHLRGPCTSILNTLTITPFERLGACCGLPREEILELDLGTVVGDGFVKCYENGRNDFLKIWLASEGPEHILSWAAEYDPTIEWEGKYSHQCDSCRAVYKDPKVGKVIQDHYRDKLPEILLRFVALEKSD